MKIDVKQRFISDGFEYFIQALPFNFNFEDERSLRNPSVIRLMARLCFKAGDFNKLFTKCKSIRTDSAVTRVYREVFNAYRDLMKDALSKDYGEYDIYQLTYGNAIASKVAMILSSEGIVKFKELSYVSKTDCERLGIRKDSRKKFVDCLSAFDYGNLLERLR